MRRTLSLLALFLGLLTPPPVHAALRVVASLPSLAALAREVGGEWVDVHALSSPREDPHYVDARPNLIVALNRADLLIVNGLELEIGWIPPLQTAARNAAIQIGAPGYLDASVFVQRLEVPTVKIERSMGDIHPGGNPHFLFDPRAMARIARGIAARLAELDPTHADDFQSGGERVAGRLETLARQERARFDALPAEKRRVVSYHRSFPYLLDWLGLTEVATVEPKPGIPPDPAHVSHVLELMRAQGVRTIVQEAFYPDRTSRTLATLVQGRVVTVSGGAAFGEGQTVADHLARLAGEVYDALAK